MTPAGVLAVMAAAEHRRDEVRRGSAPGRWGADERQVFADAFQAEVDAWKTLTVPSGTSIDVHQLLLMASVSAAARAAELAASWRELAEAARAER